MGGLESWDQHGDFTLSMLFLKCRCELLQCTASKWRSDIRPVKAPTVLNERSPQFWMHTRKGFLAVLSREDVSRKCERVM